MTNDTFRKVFNKLFAKYQQDWSDKDCPLTLDEKYAYLAGFEDAWNARGDTLEQALNRQPKVLPELKKLIDKPNVWDNPADTSQNVEYEN